MNHKNHIVTASNPKYAGHNSTKRKPENIKAKTKKKS